MNKKQLIVISVLVFSMLVLAVSQGFFESNFHRINTTDKVVNQFKKYKLNTDECFISIPDGWIVDEEKSEGQYISYKLKFKSANEDITGIIQVINTKEDVDVFANRDVRNQLLKFSNLKISPINNKDKNGILSEGAIYESILSIKRAGADIIITYFAKDLAKMIRDNK